MITTIIILSVLLTASVAVNINQLRKQESQSDYIDELENSNTEYYTFFQKLKTHMFQMRLITDYLFQTIFQIISNLLHTLMQTYYVLKILLMKYKNK